MKEDETKTTPGGKQKSAMPVQLTATFISRPKQPSDNSAQLNPVMRDLLGFLLLNDYVCPLYDEWLKLWFLIAEHKYAPQVIPPAPRNDTQNWSYRDLHALLISQIEFAERRGPETLQKVDTYLRQLSHDQWIAGLLTT